MGIVQRIGGALQSAHDTFYGIPSEAEFQQMDAEYTNLVYNENSLPQDVDECEAAMATIDMIPSMNPDGTFSFVDE
jgi:hypothetical protein